MMMPVARLALLRAYPRSELLPVLNFVTMRTCGADFRSGIGRCTGYMGQLALDLPD